MPTGYTAGIIDGEIKDFKQFATLCMRAFGATVHMRDEDLEKPFEPRVPSDYHTKQIEKANQLLKDARELSDNEIIDKRKAELFNSKKHYVDGIAKAIENEKRLTGILESVKAWQPPTSEHTGIKDFMIEQLQGTINQDADTTYYENGLNLIEKELQNLSPALLRAIMINKAEEDLSYHRKELAAELRRCNESNTWVEVFLTSLK
jgi:hypothetical protein